jgi:uncharacterized membrane protein YhaH (DUF805 family)
MEFPKIQKQSRLTIKSKNFMIEWYKKVVFENYANINGRARRSEYWYYVLVNVLVYLLSLILIAICFAAGIEIVGFIIIGGLAIYMILNIVPNICVLVRRLHDVNKSGWYYFVTFIPLIGSFWLIYLLCSEGDHGSNDYGKDPKLMYDELDEIGEVSTN